MSFFYREKERKSSFHGFGLDKLSSSFTTAYFYLKTQNSHTLRQLSFLHDKSKLSFSPAEVLPRSIGNASIYVKAKAFIPIKHFQHKQFFNDEDV